MSWFRASPDAWVTFLSGKVIKAKRPTRRFRQRRIASTFLRFSRRRAIGKRQAIETTGRCRDHRHRRNGLWLLSAKTESTSLAAEVSET